jgi:hypothetical protein
MFESAQLRYVKLSSHKPQNSLNPQCMLMIIE